MDKKECEKYMWELFTDMRVELIYIRNEVQKFKEERLTRDKIIEEKLDFVAKIIGNIKKEEK